MAHDALMTDGQEVRYALALIDFSDEDAVDREITLHEELTAEEYDEFASAYGKLRQALDDSLIEYLFSTLMEAERLASRVAATHVSDGIPLSRMDEIRRALLTTSLNFLSAVYMFKEHTKVRAIEAKDRALRDELLGKFNRLCETDPWVGLMLAVRHAVVHRTTAVISYRLDMQEASDGMVAFCNPVINRDAMANLKDAVAEGSEVQRLLQMFEQDPDLLVLMSDSFDSLEQFQLEIAPALESELRDAAFTVQLLAQRFPDDGDQDRLLLTHDLVHERDGHVHGQLPYVPLLPTVFSYAENLIEGEHAAPSRRGRPADPGVAVVYSAAPDTPERPTL